MQFLTELHPRLSLFLPNLLKRKKDERRISLAFSSNYQAQRICVVEGVRNPYEPVLRREAKGLYYKIFRSP